MRRPTALWLLVVCMFFLAFGGLYGGVAMLTDPTGGSLGMTEILPRLPVPNFVLPGLFLFFAMGIAPLLLQYALLARPHWRWPEKLSRKTGYHWAWSGTLATGLILIIWLYIQGMMIGFKWPIQYITGADGVLIIVLTLIPPIRRYYSYLPNGFR